MKLALIVGLAPVLAAQSVPAGLLYQAASENGIQYISPSAGQAIIDTRSGLNWHNIAGEILSDGSIGVLIGGLSGAVAMSTAIEVGLATGHTFYDHTVAPIIAKGAPNPGSVPPVLPLNGTVAPSTNACTENSMYAVWAGGSWKAAKKLRKQGVQAARVGPINVGGLLVTFVPQGVDVLKNISGQRIKAFQVIDVVACLPPSPPAAPIRRGTDGGSAANRPQWLAWMDVSARCGIE